MLKNKNILGLALAIFAIFGGMFVYANTTSNNGYGGYMNEEYVKEMEEYRKEANDFRKKLLEEDYKSGKITKSERDLWLDHYNDMEKYDSKGISFGGGCHGGRGMRGGMGIGHHGMMRGYSY